MSHEPPEPYASPTAPASAPEGAPLGPSDTALSGEVLQPSPARAQRASQDWAQHIARARENAREELIRSRIAAEPRRTQPLPASLRAVAKRAPQYESHVDPTRYPRIRRWLEDAARTGDNLYTAGDRHKLKRKTVDRYANHPKCRAYYRQAVEVVRETQLGANIATAVRIRDASGDDAATLKVKLDAAKFLHGEGDRQTAKAGVHVTVQALIQGYAMDLSEPAPRVAVGVSGASASEESQ